MITGNYFLFVFSTENTNIVFYCGQSKTLLIYEFHDPGEWHPPDLVEVPLPLQQLHLLPGHQPGLDKLLSGGEDVLDHAADPPDCQDIAQDEVPHGGVTEGESLSLLVIKQDQTMKLETEGVRIRKFSVLSPPS